MLLKIKSVVHSLHRMISLISHHTLHLNATANLWKKVEVRKESVGKMGDGNRVTGEIE